MDFNDLLIGAALAGPFIGGFVGWQLRDIYQPPAIPTDDDIALYMHHVVNQEEMEEAQRLLKFKMARNGRKTLRNDGGPNARVSRMRVRRGTRRYPHQGA